jgi:hypothetical protein
LWAKTSLASATEAKNSRKAECFELWFGNKLNNCQQSKENQRDVKCHDGSYQYQQKHKLKYLVANQYH